MNLLGKAIANSMGHASNVFSSHKTKPSNSMANALASFKNQHFRFTCFLRLDMG